MVLNTLCIIFSLSLLPLFLKEQGYGLYHIILLYALYTGLSAAIIPLVGRFSTRRFLMLGFLFFAFAVASFSLLPVSISFFFYAFFIAANICIFWITLNYIFFRSSDKTTNAVDSSFYMLTPGLIAAVIPPLSAVFAHAFGYRWLFGLSAILFLIPIWLVWKYVPEEKYVLDFVRGLRNFKGLKTITILEGSLQHFSGAIVPIYALLFLKTTLDVGLFLGYTGLIGFAIAIFLSMRSDHSQKRKKFIQILFLLMAVSIVVLPSARNAAAWYVAVGIFTVIYSISSPLRLAISLDAKKPDLEFWKTREFLLNIGRTITLGIAALIFFLQLYLATFILFALIALVYPFIVNYKLTDIK